MTEQSCYAYMCRVDVESLIALTFTSLSLQSVKKSQACTDDVFSYTQGRSQKFVLGV